MRRLTVFVLVFVFVFGFVAPSDAAEKGKGYKKCDKRCQQANDVYVTDYTDYFVNDSDGKKDSVFTVYHDIAFGDEHCDVVKSFDGSNEGTTTALAVVCPDRIVNGSGSQ